ncbi:MarR family winged helix-turn-helix transcriptional regulator [Paenibacillus sp. P25]|nr:MarR family winged helix-turn-helix transcriptional regulator [Paenibacillus sp. P25]
MDKVTDQELTAWRYFIKAHSKIIENIEHDLSQHKRVPLTTYDVLIALYEAPDRKLRFGELNGKVVLSKSGLTRLVDRLEREGLIRRERSEEDRRGAYAALTELGEQELRKAWPIYARGIKRYFATPLGESDLQAIGKAFETIYQRLLLEDQEGTSV